MFAPSSPGKISAIWNCRKAIIALAVPLLLAPFPIVIATEVSRCAYVILWMAFYFVLEPVPLSVTALLPVAAFPLLGVLSTAETTLPYMKDTIMMYLGGLTMAVAVEDCGLHRRVALRILLILGTGPRQLMLGFMVTTTILSMWISNTATTAMMVPIVQAVLEQLDKEANKKPEPKLSQTNGVPNGKYDPYYKRTSEGTGKKFSEKGCGTDEVNQANGLNPAAEGKKTSEEGDSLGFSQAFRRGDEVILRPDRWNRSSLPIVYVTPERDATRPAVDLKRLDPALHLSVAFAANLGGTGTPIGSGPNVVLQGYFSENFPLSRDMNFAKWMLFNLPGVAITNLATWVLLQAFSLPCRCRNPENDKVIRKIISQSYEELGPISNRQKKVTVVFFLLILGWFFRDPSFAPGWASLFTYGRLVGDATTSIAASLLLFMIPDGQGTVLDWKTAQGKLPWGLLLLLGSGFAVAEAAQKSGLSLWLGDQLVRLHSLPTIGIMVTLTALSSALTELISNMAVATIVLPVVFQLAKAIAVHPLYLALPVTIGCSYAFILPVGNPSNAIVYESSRMSSVSMMGPGFVVKLTCLGIQIALIQTLGRTVWDLDAFPIWAQTNQTSTF